MSDGEPMNLEQIYTDYQKTGDYQEYTERLKNYWHFHLDGYHIPGQCSAQSNTIKSEY